MNSSTIAQHHPFQPLTGGFLAMLSIGTFGYLLYRFGNAPHISLAGLVFCAFVIGTTVYGIIQHRQNASPTHHKLLAIGILTSAYVLAFSFSTHLWEGLAIIQHDNSDHTSNYLVWDRSGTSQEKVDLPLKAFHIDGDEGAHLAAVQALRDSKGNLVELKEHIQKPNGNNKAYWINRSLKGHPLGFHLLYLPASSSPPFARIMASCVFLAAIGAAYWAGQCLDSRHHFGLLTSAIFATTAHLFWFHGFRVSSDVAPCIPTFLAIGSLWKSVNNKNEALHYIKLSALYLTIACFITHTASLVVMGFIPLLWLHHRRQFWEYALWIIVPTFLITIFGIALSAYIVGPENHGIIGRFFQETGQAKKFNNEGKDLFWMLKRLPRDLGIPILGFLIWSLAIIIRSSFDNRANLFVLASAFAILIPATTLFFAEIRYTYPGWILIITGLGGHKAWKSFTASQRSILVSCFITFVLVKFMCLRTELAHAAN